LGIVTAIASSFLNKPIPPQWVFLGEVGLTGEVRAITQAEIRLIEAEKMGFKQCIIPQSNLKHLKKTSLQTIGIRKVEKAFEVLF